MWNKRHAEPGFANWPVRDEIVSAGLDDEVSMGFAAGFARDLELEFYDDVRSTTIGAITELLVTGLMVAGDLDGRGNFVAWECSAAESVSRIVTEWAASWQGDDPTPGAVAWLACTPKGRSYARSLEGRRYTSG